MSVGDWELSKNQRELPGWTRAEPGALIRTAVRLAGWFIQLLFPLDSPLGGPPTRSPQATWEARSRCISLQDDPTHTVQG